ncbi:unnamed protein product [Blumeria hordei]|uniref:Ubiquitin-like domain-containing protein n=2 Tax=Blumeria hordei TaxID=2867405 RepID=A0A383US05_BLUHO|nr:hypothetical protein BGHDH14_bgh01095 [Blumeria hordei DH14]SZF02569.1 unnamed protein product [Blumeria hordei]
MSIFSERAPSLDDKTAVLLINVRFTNSFDLPIDIDQPRQTYVAALKHMVRSKLEEPLSRHCFRFIYSGKLLRDEDILGNVLKLPGAPPRRCDPSGKGKAVEISPTRICIHCAIGDVLTPAQLAAEAEAAMKSWSEPFHAHSDTNPATSLPPLKFSSSTPRGFDRLLSSGFTAIEVNQLRLQFRSIQQSIHTPDTMPSPDTLLQIEDAWIDDNSGNNPSTSGFDFGDDSLGSGAIDDILWGNLIGFFWPLGCMGFLMRESGLWSRRRQIAVFTGFILSIAFGILRILS